MADVTETHRLLVSHIAAVRKIEGLQDAMAVLVLESNLAFEAQHIIHALNRCKVPSWVALAEGAGGTVGWLTTNGESAECATHTVGSLFVCVWCTERKEVRR